jgi:hypothetical protein
MASLAQQRCLNHECREAVCRCTSCSRFFCRECAVLFDARLLCAACLAAESAALEFQPARARFSLAGLALALLGLLVIWLFFYLAGWTLLQFRQRTPLASVAPAVFRVSV